MPDEKQSPGLPPDVLPLQLCAETADPEASSSCDAQSLFLLTKGFVVSSVTFSFLL